MEEEKHWTVALKGEQAHRVWELGLRILEEPHTLGTPTRARPDGPGGLDQALARAAAAYAELIYACERPWPMVGRLLPKDRETRLKPFRKARERRRNAAKKLRAHAEVEPIAIGGVLVLHGAEDRHPVYVVTLEVDEVGHE